MSRHGGRRNSRKRTHKHTEGTAAADRAKDMEDSFSAHQVDPDQMCLISFGYDSTGPPALPCPRDDALVENGAGALKLCLSPTEMRTLTVASGLLPAGTASTGTRIIFYQLPLRFCRTEETNYGTAAIQYATYSDFWKMKVLETKSRQTLVFDPGGSAGRLHACPFLETWRALHCGEVFVWVPDGTRGWSVVWQKDGLEYRFPKERTSDSYVLRLIAVPPTARLIRGSDNVQRHEAM